MSGLNSISGLNKVSADFRPEFKAVADSDVNKSGVEVVKSDEPQLRHDKAIDRSIVRQLDVLLLNAAKRSVTADVAENMRSVSGDLRDNDAITDDEAKRLSSLAKAASRTLAALDKYSGAELASALCDKGGKAGIGFKANKKGVLTGVAAAVKDAIDAQTNLSDELYKLTKRLSANDGISDEQFNDLAELQLQCDRRATEINSIVCRMYALAADDAANGANADPGVKEMLNAKFLELMPREALMMHGTADSLELMRKHIGDNMGKLAERLDAFAADYSKDLTQEDIVKLQADMSAMKAAVADVAKNGIRFKVDEGADKEREVRVDVDKSILNEIEGVLDGIESKITSVRAQCAKNVRAEFLEGVRDKLLPKSMPVPECDPTTTFGRYVDIVDRFFRLLDDFAARKMDKTGLNDKVQSLCREILEIKLNPKHFLDMGYSEAMTREIGSAVRSLAMIVDQYKEIVRNTEAFAKGGADPMVTAGDIRRMFLGELGVSSVVEARARGFKAEDVNPKADDANIVDSKVLGSGQSNTCYMLTARNGEKFVFKPELEARIGLGLMPMGADGTYNNRQLSANLSLATADVAKMLGFEDMVVRYSVGTHDGKFGVFMELATGVTGHYLAVDDPKNDPDFAATQSLKAEIAQSNDANKVKGQIAQQLNRLQWLDIITGQGDRHWENYFVNIDKTTHDVKVKAIDNEVAFPADRIGVQKYRLSKGKAARFKETLMQVCLAICNGDSERAKELFQDRWKNSRAMKIDSATGEVTLDLYLVDDSNRELAIAYAGFTGAQTIAFPDVIDEAMYNKLMELRDNPKLKEDFFARLEPRLSSQSLKAARKRLDDAIKYAESLGIRKKVYKDADWLTPAKRKALGNLRGSVKVHDNTGAEIELAGNGTGKVDAYVTRYLVGICKSFYKRDFMGRLFRNDGE